MKVIKINENLERELETCKNQANSLNSQGKKLKANKNDNLDTVKSEKEQHDKILSLIRSYKRLVLKDLEDIRLMHRKLEDSDKQSANGMGGR